MKEIKTPDDLHKVYNVLESLRLATNNYEQAKESIKANLEKMRAASYQAVNARFILNEYQVYSLTDLFKKLFASLKV